MTENRPNETNETDETDVCEICGHTLVSVKDSNGSSEISCFFCHKNFSPNIYCPNGHYVCDACHSKDAIEAIKIFSKSTDLTDPFEIADEIMSHPSFKMYGPEHHVLVPVAVLTAIRNTECLKPDGNKVSNKDIKEAIRRASKIPGGWCGFYGSCGSGMGSGIAVSIFTSATPSTDIPRSLANKTTSGALRKIADNLEHCCKRSVRISIAEALQTLNKEFDLQLFSTAKSCKFSSKNEKCEGRNCPVF